MRIPALLAGIVLLSGGCYQQKNESVLLRLKPERGDLKVVTVFLTATQKSKEILNNETEVKFIVDSVTSKGVVYLVDLLSLKMMTDVGDKKMEFNSQEETEHIDKNDKTLHKRFQNTIRALYSLSCDHRGNVTAPLKPIGGNRAVPPIDMDLIQLIFPEKKVKIGDSWTSQKKNQVLSTTNTFTYTVQAIERDYVVIDVTALVQGVKSRTPDATAKGQYVINRADGSLVWAFLNMPSAYAKVYVRMMAR
jgi:hypothetical protein